MNGLHYGLRGEAPSILHAFEGGGANASGSVGRPAPRMTIALNYEAIQQIEAAVVGNREQRGQLVEQLDAEITALSSQLQRLKDLRRAVTSMPTTGADESGG